MKKKYSEKRTESKKKAAKYLLVDDSKDSRLFPFYYLDPETPKVLTEKWQREIAEDAKRFGFIALDHLTYILAADKQYIKSLRKLWTDYQCDIRGPDVPKVATARERIGSWFTLLERLGHGRVSVVKYKLKPVPYLPLKFFNKETGELERYNHTSSRPGPAQVRLNDLKEYLNEIIKIPLPALLYLKPPSKPEQDASLDDGENTTGDIISHNEQRSPKSEGYDPASSKDFINRLKVSRESNSQIKFKEPGKNPEVRNCIQLGFKNERTKEWKTLIEVLENKGHVLSLGSAGGSAGRSYDAQQKRLGQINKKLTDFFNKHYSLQLPHDFKLYELCKDGRSGTYRFKFQVAGNLTDSEKTDSEYRNKTKEQLIEEFEQLAEKYKENIQDEKVTMKLTTLSKFLREKGWITKEEITKAIKGFRDTEIKYDPYENVKDLPPQY